MKKGDMILISADFLEDRKDLPHEYLEFVDCKNNIVKALHEKIEYYMPVQVVILKKELKSEIF